MGQSQNKSDSGAENDRTRTHELSWALLDDLINGQELAELEDLLLNDKTARENYISCIQLHAELNAHFAAPKDTTKVGATKTPVLGFLGTDSGPLTGLNTPKS